MASLKDVTTLVEELEQLVGRLSDEVARGSTDFLQVVGLADEVAEFADSLASTFSAVDEQIGRRLAGATGNSGRRTQSQSRRGATNRQQQSGRAKRQPQRRKPNRQTKSDGARRSAASAPPAEEPTKTALLEQAKEVGIPGRSEMSKDELAEAVEAQERQTKEELLEQAQAAGIPGRSEMSKQELLEALRTDASLTREELLERANEADIPGRSEMTKEELREALRSVSR